VSQPYKLKHDHIRQIMAFCDANDLEVEIAGWPSWWKPGMALTVIIQAKEDQTALTDIGGGHGKE
jgi:hypothetical protein